MPGVGEDVWVERRKWPDAPHYGTNGVVLGEDEHGVWVGAVPGSTIRMPDGSERTGDRFAVWCVPHDDWFLLHLWHGHPEVDLYIDICTPAVWNERGARMVDLDLDVVVWSATRGGRAELVDVDEFDDHRVSLGYPDDVVDGARRAAEAVLGRVRAGDPPFTADVTGRWLEQLRSSV